MNVKHADIEKILSEATIIAEQYPQAVDKNILTALKREFENLKLQTTHVDALGYQHKARYNCGTQEQLQSLRDRVLATIKPL